MTKNVCIIIGARPNFMKAFPVYEALKNDFNLTLIHTGQHFDAKMSDVFFNQLKFPKPDIHLTLEKKTKAGDFDDKLYVNNKEYLKDKDKVIQELMEYSQDLGQLGEIRDKLKAEFEKINPDLVIVFGDVTSTLSAGLASKMLNIDLAHVESGLRSRDMLMPEEVNRVLTDHITKYYFVTEQSGVDNLKEIGITDNVYLVGNTMIDTQKKYLQQAVDTKYHETLGVKSKEYILITLHRPSNVDDLNKLKEIFDDFEELSKKETLVYPIHPRTKNNLEKLGYLKKVQENKNIILDEPLGYLEFTCLMANCKYIVTDSGGLQEESTALDIPCFTLRENTERPSTFIENNGTNQLISKISEIELKECKGSMDLWDGKSSEKINDILLKNVNIIKAYGYKKQIINELNSIDNNSNNFYNFKGLNFLSKLQENNKNIVIIFHGAVSGNNVQRVIFRGYDWNIDKTDIICISDFLLDKYNKYIINWTLETKKYKTDAIYKELFRYLINKKIYSNIIFTGTSGGGFPSIKFACMFNAIGLISNSQIYVENHPLPRHLKKGVRGFQYLKDIVKEENDEIIYEPNQIQLIINSYKPKKIIIYNNKNDYAYKSHTLPLVEFIKNNKIENLFDILPFEYNKPTQNGAHYICFPDNKKHIDVIRNLIISLS